MDGPSSSRDPRGRSESDLPAVESAPVFPDPPSPVAAVVPDTGELQTEAMRASWWTAVQALLGAPIAVVVNLVVARALGPLDYGMLASYTAAFALATVVLNAGISDATIQWGAAAHARGDRAELLQMCRRCAGFHLFVQTPLAAVTGFVLLHRESLAVQTVGAIAVAVTLALGTTTVTLTAISMNTALAKVVLTVGFGIQAAVVTAAVASHDPGVTWDARLVVATLLPAAALVVAPADVRRAAFRPLLPRGWPTGFARFSVRAAVAGLITTLVFSRCEVLLLDAYGKDAAAGLFALAAGLAVQVTGPVDAALGPMVPAAASLVAVGRERAAAAVLRGMRLSALATVPVALVVVPAVATLTPVVYGRDFSSTGRLFVALGLVSCLQSVLHPVTAFLSALRRPLLVLAVSTAALAVDLGLVLALVPVWGAAGAVVGNSAGQVVSLAASVWLLRRHLSLSGRATVDTLAPILVVAATSAVGSSLGLVLLAGGRAIWLATVVAVVVSAAAGLLALRSTDGIVTSSDLGSLADTFPRARPALRGVTALGWVRTDVLSGGAEVSP